VDKNKLWINGTAKIDPEKVVESTGFFSLNNNDKFNIFNSIIQKNLFENNPTLVRYNIRQDQKHFAMVVGARYDAKGTITDYLMRDPGTSQASGAYVPVKTLYNHKWKISIDKIYWILKNK